MQKPSGLGPSSSSTARMRAVALRMLARLTTVVSVSLDTLHARGSSREEPLMASPEPATAGRRSCHIGGVWSVSTMADRDGKVSDGHT
jgi:hypothetical protein